MKYNLLEEEWIPVLYHDGRWTRIGISQVLEDAGRIRQIAASNPMDRVSILRFLLALLYWCKGKPPSDAEGSPGDPFPNDWFSKLDDNKDCFNLLGEGKRFYQYRRAAGGKDERLTVNYLVQEVPTGTNKWHFRHSTDKENGLCPACCAMGLLRLPLFATSGGRGKPPGVNSKPPIYVIPMGLSLAETLRLSWRQVGESGTPAWKKPDMQLPKEGKVRLLTGLTWLPRRVWLDDPEGPQANCASCGRREHLIRHSVFAPIGSTKTDEGGPGRIWRDPHVIYEQSRKGDLLSLHARNALGAIDAGAGQWAKIVVGILRKQQYVRDKVNIWIVGFSTVQNDKYLETMECLFAFPGSTEQVEPFVDKIERWQKGSFSLASKLKPPDDKKSSRKHAEIPAMLAAIRPHVEGRVCEKAGALMAGRDETWQQAAAEYRPMMEAISRALSPGYTTAAVQWRKQIANALPDVRPKTESAKKPGRKKGGDK